MAKRESLEEAKARLEKVKDKLARRFAEPETDNDLSPEDTPGGLINGPTDELSFRRLIREIRESGDAEDDDS